MVPTMPLSLVEARREQAEKEEKAAMEEVYDSQMKVWGEDLVDRVLMAYDGKDMRDLAIEGSLPVKPPKPRQIAGYDYYTDATGIPVVKKTLDIASAVQANTGRSEAKEVYWPITIENDEYTGVTYWDTVAGEERLKEPTFPETERRTEWGSPWDTPSTPFDGDAIIEEVRQFIEWIDEHELSVEQRLEKYREQRRKTELQRGTDSDRTDPL